MAALLFPLLLITCIASTFGQAGPGNLTFAGALGDMTIWMDLKIPAADGAVTGAYLYTKYGKEIALQGGKKGGDLALTESYRGKATGIFKLRYSQNRGTTKTGEELEWISLEGAWNKPGKAEGMRVRLFQAKPENKACRLIQADELSLESSESFGSEMDSYDQLRAEHPPEGEEEILPRDYSVTGCAKGVFSAVYTHVYYPGHGPINESQTFRHTFDRKKKREIKLMEEIDTARLKKFDAYISSCLDPKLSGVEHEGGNGDLILYLSNKTILIGYVNYFGISTLESADLGLPDVEIYAPAPFGELKKYLKKNSVLRTLESWAD